MDRCFDLGIRFDGFGAGAAAPGVATAGGVTTGGAVLFIGLFGIGILWDRRVWRTGGLPGMLLATDLFFWIRRFPDF